VKLYAQRRAAAYLRPDAKRRRTLDDSDTLRGDTFNHDGWDALLRDHVMAGLVVDGVVTSCVDYAAMARDDRFDDYLRALAAVNLDALAPAERLALLINGYNALCCSLIVARERVEPGVLRSITALPGLTGLNKSVWDQTAGVLGGVTVSLGQVEHTMLRGEWDEPGLHMCIVCASASCPDLRTEAYVASRLRQQMREQASTFVANPSKGLSWDGRTLTLSRILYWFSDDFGGPAAARRFAIEAIADDALVEAIKDAQRSERCFNWMLTSYFAYNWTLNRKPGRRSCRRN